MKGCYKGGDYKRDGDYTWAILMNFSITRTRSSKTRVLTTSEATHIHSYTREKISPSDRCTESKP